jgi:hypothetical protein
MRRLLVALAALCFAAPLPAGDQAKAVTFSKDSAGKVPAGWKVDKTGKGAGSSWRVVADDTAPGKTGFALMQTAESPSAMFNLCVLEDSRFLDGEVEVAFKAVKGDHDQGGGIVWRYQDANNYYIARMNPLEDNLRLYKVMDGKRIQLATDDKVNAASGTWHTLKIKHTGKKIEVYFDGKKLLEATDDAFAKAGKVGLWTKADAQTRFDMLVVRAAGKEP